MVSLKRLRKRLQEDQLINSDPDVVPIMVVYEPKDFDELIEGKRRCVPAMLVLIDSEEGN